MPELTCNDRPLIITLLRYLSEKLDRNRLPFAAIMSLKLFALFSPP
jgi:hypothetical protein